MVGTALPILLDIAAVHHYNPIAVGLLWLFASLGTLFIYQASSFVLGYSYGYFGAIDFLKIGAILTVVEGIFIMVLVPVVLAAGRFIVAPRAVRTTRCVDADRECPGGDGSQPRRGGRTAKSYYDIFG